MEERLKKKCRNERMVITVVLVIIGVVFLGISKLAIFDVIGGATKIGKETDYAALEGKYVSFNMQLPLAEYERVSSRNTDTGVETLKQIAYVVYDPDNNCYVGVMKYKAAQSEMDKKMDQAWDYLYSNENQPESEIVSGTLIRMDSTDRKYWDQTISKLEEYLPQIDGVYYYVDAGRIKGMNVATIVVLTLLGLAMIGFGIYYVAGTNKSWDKDVEKYLQKHPEIDRNMLERDIEVAKDFNGKSVFCGRRWIFAAGARVAVYDATKYVWGYYYRRTGRNAVSQARLFDINKKMDAINMSEKEAKAMLSHMYDAFPQIVVGYDKEWEKLYNKNFNEFLNLRYRGAMENQASSDDMNF